MKILFIAEQLYFPQLYGGVQTSTDELCHALIEKGHKVAVLVKLMPGGLFALKSRVHMRINKRLSGCAVSKDVALGYPVWRTWFPSDAVEYVAKKEGPDIIVVSTGQIVPLILAAKRTVIPILAQLNDVAFHMHGGRFDELGNMPCVANSNFTAEQYNRKYGIKSAVIYPFMSLEKYKAKSTKENVAFINPHPRKGLNIALQIAGLCPEIPFSFVEGWTLSTEQRQELRRKISSLPNVTFLRSQKDMRKIYGKCKILLAPSVCEETYGRVATEAQISGIPVVASARGGLPEAVGPGGILLDPDGPIDDWVKAVRKLWQDQRYYAELSAAAELYAERREITFTYQIDAWERTLVTASAPYTTRGGLSICS